MRVGWVGWREDREVAWRCHFKLNVFFWQRVLIARVGPPRRRSSRDIDCQGPGVAACRIVGRHNTYVNHVS